MMMIIFCVFQRVSFATYFQQQQQSPSQLVIRESILHCSWLVGCLSSNVIRDEVWNYIKGEGMDDYLQLLQSSYSFMAERVIVKDSRSRKKQQRLRRDTSHLTFI